MNTTPTPISPPPLLTAGTHLTPEDGACLMEYVSVLAGEPWSDAPTTTHPLLAHLARLVNDAASPTAPQELMPYAARLVHLDSPDPAITPALAELVSSHALRVAPSALVAWLHAIAERHLRRANRVPPVRQPGRAQRVRLRVYARGAAFRAVETAVVALCRGHDADRELLALLEQAVALVEASKMSPSSCPTSWAPSSKSRVIGGPTTRDRAQLSAGSSAAASERSTAGTTR